MKYLKLALPLSSLLLAACGGGGTTDLDQSRSDSAAALNEKITNAVAGETVELSADDDIADIKFAALANGVTVKVVEGDLAGVEITKLNSLDDSGAGSLRILSPGDEEGTVSTNLITTSSIDDWTAATLAVSGAEDDIDGSRVEDGFTYTSSKRIKNGVTFDEGAIKYTSDGVQVEGNVGAFEGVEGTGGFVSVYRDGFAGLLDELPIVPVSYTGHTVMFTNDDTGDNYTDTSTKIVLDFAEGTGTFEANNFVPSDNNQGADREISVVGDLDLNTSVGALSSASEATVTVNGQTSGGFINGLLTGDVTGAAGSIVVYDAAATDGVNVGVFAVKQ